MAIWLPQPLPLPLPQRVVDSSLALSEATSRARREALDSLLTLSAEETDGEGDENFVLRCFAETETTEGKHVLRAQAHNGLFPTLAKPTSMHQGARMKVEGRGGIAKERTFPGGCLANVESLQKEHKEVLWHDLYPSASLWWDNRQDKKSPRHAGFSQRRLSEALRMDHRYKSPWTDNGTLSPNGPWGSQMRWILCSAATLTSGNEVAQVSCEEGYLSEAVEALDLLVQEGSYVDIPLLYRVIKRCIGENDLLLGRRVHALALRSGYGSNAFLANHIITMYASHGKLDEATKVFNQVDAPNEYMWASMISAYAEHGQPTEAINLYGQMRLLALRPNSYVLVAVIKACATAVDLGSGKEVHADILGTAAELDVFVGNGLVDMYAKCGSLEDARRVFDGLPMKDVVTWNAMIGGYVQNGRGEEGLTLYGSMQQQGMTAPNRVTFVCLLQACGSTGALHLGKQLHGQIQQRGLEADVVLGCCLVDMYATCGSLEEARGVFDRLPSKNVVTWTALLNGYAQSSDAQMAMQCFKEMLQQGVKPDGATFVCLLVACSHEGLVSEGQQYFKMMSEDHSILPTVKHFNCMVDILGRSGHLHEAETMLKMMPLEKDVVGWTSLLTACKSYGDIERGRRCFDRLITLESANASAYAYVLLANMYANAGRWGDVSRIEGLRKSAGALKKPAKACIEVSNKVHQFTVGEERADVSSTLRNMNFKLKVKGGHVPHTDLVLKAVPESEKEDALCGHAEKLALAYGLLNTPDGTTLLVTKNLRMCNDCHSSTKIMSALEKREILVRDAHRVHRFRNGFCSCRDRH